MDYYEARDDLDDPPLEQQEDSPIQKLFKGAHVFITGASGFMGRVLLEKILRTCDVAQIFILVRDKKGVKSQERLSSILDDRLFESLKLQKPGEVRKVRVVTGDCSEPGLGLGQEDLRQMSSVNLIYHVAANLQMDQHLKIAYTTNVLATKCLLEFARTLPQLKAFMYVSTAYTHAYRDLVEETFYSVIYDEEEIGQICRDMDDHQIGALTPKLIGRWTNTYALTKACAENLVSKYDGVLPIGVVRPSIVVSTWREPLVGWINNVYGAVGVVTGTALGLMRLWCADPDMVGDMIPVDTAINMTLAATWEVAVSNTQLKIYNLVSSPKNPITYDILRTANFGHGANERMESINSIAVPSFMLVKNKTAFTLLSIWYHVIPGILMDMYLQFIGKTPKLKKVYTKIYNVNKNLMPYCVDHDIVFTANNVDRLWETLDPLDKKLFLYDLRQLDWDYFWLQGLKGMRVYLINEPMDTVPQGIKHYRKLLIRKLLFDSIIWSFLGTLGYLILKSVVSPYL
ncbi:fatty acyl-CoA reductase wat-like [Macrosteles quadrilineatus]|uniref:fatty acyl-CoA reductase wat-like n=1 Tax=Macrosteles quadrilineatus TaxID=74068 RepID=UPI0023E1FD11|nr:fatty acyl-CoA reductase wat-like [Macrosteles quadrilineatus]XP_054260770.1 fatty acyl-CoA reductase wat-like [Macrosteles quadrilineatus]XP_054264935.1 fatty acyl-CoA reductase wat-like [Macrosteles quadrilineatus]XP_054264936.1 fatty acyl-CoA reductase wat-like [Macrosteles quadrilineatus]